MRYTMSYKICERFKSNADIVTVQTSFFKFTFEFIIINVIFLWRMISCK